MATLLFAAAGSALGGSIGGSILGVSMAAIGQGIGAAIGRTIDNRLLAGLNPIKQEGARLDSLETMTSQEGASLPVIEGRVRVAGEVIWATKLREEARTETTSVGSGKSRQSVETRVYDYYCSFAISLGEGQISHIGRVWANDKLVDLSDVINEGRVRLYRGTETQAPDPLIDTIEGGAPAYRGTAYIVIEDLLLNDWGNAIPQIKVECYGETGEMEKLVRGVNIIPGATEWGYMPEVVQQQTLGAGGAVVSETPENAHRHAKISDWEVATKHMRNTLPNCDTSSLVVAWFGTDLRAGDCEIEPRVEVADKVTDIPWAAGGLTRATATVVSTDAEGRPAYGSTPADISVIKAIRDLKEKGQSVVLYPFIMMDITDEQALPSPDGAGTQGAYPWRGRIMPTSGGVRAQIDAFVGTAAPSDFSVDGDVVTYTGPSEWRFRRFILHLAHLAKAAGGVDAFLIGTEMRGLTMAYDSTFDEYTFVNRLMTLAAEVSAILPGAKISYGADWSEYHSHQDGNDLRFHLDPLWASPHIDFIGIDNYLPLSDWRGGTTHLDYDASKGHTSVYNLDYLKSNIEGGEYWDWFYASEADRDAQNRTPITDGTYGEPWVYRQKAIRDWHTNAHHPRTNGVRATTATAWVPNSKPFWFTELGCPAVDNGANRPNVFSSSSSSEGALPWFSAGVRDDFMQRQFLRASIEWWAENGGTTLDVADIQVWCWDARPWPEFPLYSSVWSDAPDWYPGHWLNGRAGAAPAAEAIARRLERHHGLSPSDFDLTQCYGQADGYPVAAPVGFRDFMQPLEIGLGLQSHERDGVLTIETRAAAITVSDILEDVMVDSATASPFKITRAALEDVAASAVVQFTNGLGNYTTVSTRALMGVGFESGVATASINLVLDFDRGTAAAERLLRAASDGRESISFRLPRSATYVRPGVILPVRINGDPEPRPMIVERIVEGVDLLVEARSFNHGGYAPTGGVFRPASAAPVFGSSAVLPFIFDLPTIEGIAVDDWDSVAAFHANPWPRAVVFDMSPDGLTNFERRGIARARATVGETTTALTASCLPFWDGAAVHIKLFTGSLVARDGYDVLAGANRIAIQHPTGWEVLQFRDATLVGLKEWQVSGLLRGQFGTNCEIDMDAPLPSGAAVVVLNNALAPLGLNETDVGLSLAYRFGPIDDAVATHNQLNHTGQALQRRPFSPCHLRAAKSGGDIALTWIRRTREGGDASWVDGVSEVPLGEVSEIYRLEVVSGGTLVRTVDVTAPAFTYTAAMAASDGVTTPYTVRVAQVSSTYGPGPSTSLQIE